jgi:hypothetical protein
MKITITINESIRVAPYEVIKPSISIEYEVPQGTISIDDFYKEKYREVKRIWNMHLYNQLYSSSKRHKTEDLFEFAQDLVLGKEQFPTFVLKTKKKENKDAKPSKK